MLANSKPKTPATVRLVVECWHSGRHMNRHSHG